MRGNKIMAALVVFVLIASVGIVFNTAVVAERKVEPSTGNANWILSNDGLVSKARNLTCGEEITLQITNNSLEPDTQYYLGVWNGTGWQSLKTVTTKAESDDYGDLSADFYVPGWSELNHCPTTANGTGLTESVWPFNLSAGQWNISLFASSTLNETNKAFSDMNITIQIGNLYFVEFYDGSTELDNLVYNKVYSDFKVKIYNWTGTTLEQAKDDSTKYKFDVSLQNFTDAPPSDEIESLATAETDGVTNGLGLKLGDNIYAAGTDTEKTFWINVEHSEESTYNSTIPLPVLLNVTLPSPPSDVEWGDTFTVSGKVLDGAGTGLKSYPVRVYYPVSGGYSYDAVTTPSTVTTGTYSLTFETGSGKGFGAGTWYVGTPGIHQARVDMKHESPYIDGFIPYHSFEVGTKELDEDTVDIENTADIVSDFAKTVNVSVDKETWMDNYEFQNMSIHFTDIQANYSGVEYGRDDIVQVTPTVNKQSDIAYYEFDVTFLEARTGTIWVSYPGNLTAIQGTDEVNSVTSSYSDRFGNHSTSLIANITGTTTFSVVSPGTMTVLVDNEPTKVTKKDIGTGWINQTLGDPDIKGTNVSVYGASEDSHKNATITVSGCGLDFTIEEGDLPADNKYLSDYGFDDDGNGAWYNITIIPKTAGTLKISVTNGTNTVEKTYTVTGLIGSVTTEGDDLEITVGTTETITLSGINTYSEIKITLVDEEWSFVRLLNESEEDADDPLSFTPDADDIDQCGYIAVVAKHPLYAQYMYDLIEVVPVEDLEIELVSPDAANDTLTVGLEHEMTIRLVDDNGDPVVDGTPEATAKLIDDDNDEDNPLQEWTFTAGSEDGEFEATIQPWFEGQLVIDGVNDTTGIKHLGSKTLEVDYSTITYTPGSTTAGIGTENLTVEVTAVDANDNSLPDGTYYLKIGDGEDTGPDFDTSVELTDGVGEFEINDVGDNKTTIVLVLQDNDPADGNKTSGEFNIDHPNFEVDPEIIYVGQSNTVEITATDMDGNELADIYLTLMRAGNTDNAPEPVETDANGIAELSISPLSNGKYNVTIVKSIVWADGQLDWSSMDYVVTETIVTATAIKPLTISFSKSPITEGETLTVTVKSGNNAVAGVTVEFGAEEDETDANGQVEFTAPDPSVSSAIYTVYASKVGYNTAEKSITVIKSVAAGELNAIITPTGKIAAGGSITVEVLSGTTAAVGATVTFNGENATVGSTGRVTFTAPEPDEETTYDIDVTYGEESLTKTVTVKAVGAEDDDDDEKKEEPGFELLTLIAAIGVAFILLKRRRKYNK